METVGPLVELITTKGWGVIFVALWWLERSERVRIQTAKDELLTRTLEAISSLRQLITGRTNAPPG